MEMKKHALPGCFFCYYVLKLPYIVLFLIHCLSRKSNLNLILSKLMRMYANLLAV